VSLRGDFAPDGWTTGVPMALDSGIWSVETDVPWATQVLYKFLVDGTWMVDPANPNTVPDGYGGTTRCSTA